MLAVPVVEIRDGRCVSILRAPNPSSLFSSADPRAVVGMLLDEGFGRFHVVDLDATSLRGSNRRLVENLLTEFPGVAEVSGGTGSMSAIEDWLEAGALSVVPDVRFAADPDWRSRLIREFPHALVLPVRVIDRRILSTGWAKPSMPLLTYLEEALDPLLAGILVELDPRSTESALGTVTDIAEMSPVSVAISGPLTASTESLRALDHRGASEALVAELIYSNTADFRTITSEFSTPSLSGMS